MLHRYALDSPPRIDTSIAGVSSGRLYAVGSDENRTTWLSFISPRFTVEGETAVMAAVNNMMAYQQRVFSSLCYGYSLLGNS